MSSNLDYTDLLSSFNSRKFLKLRDAQAYVLQEYSTNHNAVSDLAIELPTGAGKTLIALLIAEVWRRDAKKAAILSANKTLARQLADEAEVLGIPAVLMEGRGADIPARDKRDYQRANKVAIMNYWVYFNQNPVIDASDLLIMDDAHLAEHCLHSLFSIEISAFAHESLFRSLITELQIRFPEYSILADALDEEGMQYVNPPELLSFIDQLEVSNRIREIIDTSPSLESDPDLRFRWKKLRMSLKEANIYLSAHSIWIRPYIYPLISNDHYNQTVQRIYMSATVGDPNDLSRRLGVKSITKLPVPPKYAETTSGRRLIVMNQIEERDIPERLQQVILAVLRIHPKSVWLCSSYKEAQELQKDVSEWLNQNGLVGHPTWLLTPTGDEIEDFKISPAGHLFVAGRFDGMDFKADECRLIVLKTLPRAINTQEEFISSYLRDSGFMLRRLNQRIVQALGRCNRADDDFGIYVLADRRFATHFGRESNKEGLPRNIVAEIDMAQDATEDELKVLIRKVESFLQGDFTEYNRDIQNYLEGAPISKNQSQLVETAENEVIGWARLFASQNYDLAADHFEVCWDKTRSTDLLEIAAFHGWQWAKALYLQSLQGEPGAQDKALAVLETAIKHGGKSGWFNRIRTSLNRAKRQTVDNKIIEAEYYSDRLIQAFDDLLEDQGGRNLSKFDKWHESITNLLHSSNHKQYQEGLERLGFILGYQATRPRYNSATDCRWRGLFGNEYEVITFEAKIEHNEEHPITASDIGQAHNQLVRAMAEYDKKGFLVRGTIVTHLTKITSDADAAAGTIKIINKSAILALWGRVKLILSLYRDDWSVHNLAARIAAAQRIRSKLPSTGWLIRALDSDQRFITEEQLLAEWSS